MKHHRYRIPIGWSSENGTASYHSYSRNHTIGGDQKKMVIPASSDPGFRGDPSHYNPEELFVGSIASCHMLWYLHLCTVNKITVVNYQDSPEGQMTEKPDGSGAFDWVKLTPEITILEKDKEELAHSLHQEAHKKCFIANSVNCTITVRSKVNLH